MATVGRTDINGTKWQQRGQLGGYCSELIQDDTLDYMLEVEVLKTGSIF